MLKPNKSRAWLETDLRAVVHNYKGACAMAPEGCEVMSIVKANAYGLGAVPVAKALQEAGCTSFGVACIEEAEELRLAGITGKLLVLATVPLEFADYVVREDIEFPVMGLEQARRCSDWAVENHQTLKLHLKVDIGLGRLGLVLKDRMEEAVEEAVQIFALPGIAMQGVMSMCIGSAVEADNLEQLDRFTDFCGRLKAKGLSFARHCLTTIPFVEYPAYSFEGVRLGALLYGSVPEVKVPFDLQPVVNLYTRVLQVKTLPPGSPIGYGPLFYTERETRVATIKIGFGDGLRRSVINGGCVLIHGKRVPFIGKLSCDSCTVDVTGIPDVKEGDLVTIFGRDGDEEQGIDVYAEIYPASVSEVTTELSPRLSRFYI